MFWGMDLDEMTDEQFQRFLDNTPDEDLQQAAADEFAALIGSMKLRLGAALARLEQEAQWFRERGEEPPHTDR